MRKCENYFALLGEFVSFLQKKEFSVKREPVMLSGLLLSALVQRLYDFGTIAYRCLEQDKTLPAALLVRSLMETIAVLLAVIKEVEAAVTAKDTSSLYDRLSQVAFGGRRDDIDLKAINILTYIDRAGREIPGFRQNYDLLSEYAHPNMFGVFGGYLSFGEGHETVTLGRGSSIAAAVHACPILFRVCLAQAVTGINKYNELLPDLRILVGQRKP